MRTEDEIRALRDKLENVTSFIGDFGSTPELQSDKMKYACNVLDTIDWVLGETSTDNFQSEGFLDMDNLYGIGKRVERQTGETMKQYSEKGKVKEVSPGEEEAEKRLMDKAMKLLAMATEADEEAVDEAISVVKGFAGESLDKPYVLYSIAVEAGEEAVDEAMRVLKER